MTSQDLTVLILSFLWGHLFTLLTQFFCLALVIKIVRSLIP
jgi:hypothetical protein